LAPVRSLEHFHAKVQNLSIKRGDHLVMTIRGTSESVVALLDEFDGSVMVRLRGGATGKRSVKNMRPDASVTNASPAPQIVETRPDVPNVSALCPICREASITTRLAGSDDNLRIVRVMFICAQNHEWEAELPQTRRES
jgi:hypothetical protein